MATSYFKVEKSGELSLDEAHRAVSGQAHQVVRVDVRKGKTTIYYSADKKSGVKSAERGSAATEVKLAEVTKL